MRIGCCLRELLRPVCQAIKPINLINDTLVFQNTAKVVPERTRGVAPNRIGSEVSHLNWPKINEAVLHSITQ